MGNNNIKLYSLEEIINENRIAPRYVLMNNYVYDISDIIYKHPGGSTCIINRCYTLEDCYKDFKFHRSRSQNIWKKRLVGKLIN